MSDDKHKQLKQNLRELIEKWRGSGKGMQAVAKQSNDGELYTQGKTMELKADELEELINDE